MKQSIKNLFRFKVLSRNRVHLSANISLDTSLGKHVSVGKQVRLSSCSVSDYTYFSEGSVFERTSIGKFVSIGPQVLCGLAEHPTFLISTYPGFYSNACRNSYFFGNKIEYNEFSKTYIESDVWIGARVTILSGIKIGVGAIIGAGSIVTKDVEPYSIVAGVPARIIRYRFDSSVINQLIKSKWWNQPIDKIKLASNYSGDPLKFINSIGQ